MKKAICFGINNYPGESNDLMNCVNDAKDWSRFLQVLGYEVETFTDNECTLWLFKTKIKELIATSTAGDYLVLTYSGHGTQVIDRSGDEADGYDEAICLHDGNLVDDEIALMIKDLKDRIHCFLNFDCCFSGSATRNGVKIKYRKTDDIPLNKVNKRRKRFGKNLINMKEVYLSGCSDKEYSYDANELHNGAETEYALACFVPGMTYKQWHKAIRKKLPSTRYPQTPQLEGTNDNLELKALGCSEQYIEPFNICDFIKRLFHL